MCFQLEIWTNNGRKIIINYPISPHYWLITRTWAEYCHIIGATLHPDFLSSWLWKIWTHLHWALFFPVLNACSALFLGLIDANQALFSCLPPCFLSLFSQTRLLTPVCNHLHLSYLPCKQGQVEGLAFYFRITQLKWKMHVSFCTEATVLSL